MKIYRLIFLMLGLTSLSLSVDGEICEDVNQNAVHQLQILAHEIRCGRTPKYPDPPISIKVHSFLFIMCSENFDPDSYPADSYPAGYKMTCLEITRADGTLTKYPSFSIEKEFVVSSYLGSGLEGSVFKVIDADTQEKLAIKVYIRPRNMMDLAMMKYRFYLKSEQSEQIKELCNLPLYVDLRYGLTVSPLLDSSKPVDCYSDEYTKHLKDLDAVLPDLCDRSSKNVMYDFNGKLKAIDFC